MVIGRIGLAAVLVGLFGAGADQGQVPAGVGSGPVVGQMSGIGIGAFGSNIVLPAVKGLPYSLIEKTTRIQVLADGTTITHTTEERRMRDSEGRERTESGSLKDGEFEVRSIRLVDPVGRTLSTMFPRDKSAHVTHLAEAKPVTPEQQAKAAEFRAKAEAYRQEHPSTQDVEELPGQTVAGMYAVGKRRTMVVPAGKMGNDREIRVVTETWRSPDLKITLSSTTDDPRSGKTTRVVSEVQRAEPSAALFEVPGDYRVTEQK